MYPENHKKKKDFCSHHKGKILLLQYSFTYIYIIMIKFANLPVIGIPTRMGIADDA